MSTQCSIRLIFPMPSEGTTMGQYNGALTREQFLYPEMRIAAQMKFAGMTDSEILKKVCEENLFQYPTDKELRSKCRACLKRVASLEARPEMLRALAEGMASEARQAALIAMMCQSRLLAEFMVSVIGEKYRNLDFSLTRLDVNLFFDRLRQQDADVARWSEQTVSRIKSVFRQCLRGAGFMAPGSDALQPVYLPEAFVLEMRRTGLGCFLPAFNIFE